MVEARAAEEAENVEENCAKKVKLGEDDELNEKISKQVEYYFSDVNVVKDKFMQEEFRKDDGWVSVSTLLTFVRLKEISKDEAKICQALKKSNSDVIEFDEKEEKVRRKHPVPDLEVYQKQLSARTVHISGFPTEYGFETLRRFCATYGEVESLSMRRFFKSRFFKGCIHVVFKNEADAKKVLETNPLKCKDRELRTESMPDYCKRKEEMKEKRKAKFESKNKTKKEDQGDEAKGDEAKKEEPKVKAEVVD